MLTATPINNRLSDFRHMAELFTRRDDAYFARCGRDTMTQDDIDQGRLRVLVGVAPLRPAEFVVIDIARNLGHATVEHLSLAGRPGERVRLGDGPVRAAGFVLQIREESGWVTWSRVAELASAGPQDTVFHLDPQSGELTFGDGQHGAIPPTGTDNLRVSYRSGSGDPD
jgi:hypothetical protein